MGGLQRLKSLPTSVVAISPPGGPSPRVVLGENYNGQESALQVSVPSGWPAFQASATSWLHGLA